MPCVLNPILFSRPSLDTRKSFIVLFIVFIVFLTITMTVSPDTKDQKKRSKTSPVLITAESRIKF